MSFQDVKLPAATISDMYRKVLVDEREVKHGPTPDIKFLGGNTRRITAIATGKKELSETSPEVQFLLKILNACQLTLNDIALIDVRNIGSELKQFADSFRPDKILLFSSVVNGGQISAESLYHIEKISGCQVLYCPEVAVMMGDGSEAVAVKKKLWGCLKSFFNV